MEQGSQRNFKTSIILDKRLIEEIDRHNPFSSRKKFLDQACRTYLVELKRKAIDLELAKACRDSAEEDLAINEDWEGLTLETWK